MKEVLMCRPTAFDVVYAINPWMEVNNKPNKTLALKQWQNLYDTYQKLGVKINLIEQGENVPDMVFTTNAGVVWENTFIASNFRPAERKPEEVLFQQWFKDNGYQLKTLDCYHSGEGDALEYNNKLYCDYGYRSSLKATQQLAKLVDVDAVKLEIIDPFFYDLDLTFCPLGDRAVMYYPKAYSQQSQEILAELPNAIELNHEQVANQFANSVYANGKLIISGCDDKLRKQLHKFDIEPIIIDVSEFRKAGGGIKCMTLKLA